MIKFVLTSPWEGCGVSQVVGEETLGCTEETWLRLTKNQQEKVLLHWGEKLDIRWVWEETEEEIEKDPTDF